MLKENNPCNLMPADVVANGIVIAAYECGKKHENRYEFLLFFQFSTVLHNRFIPKKGSAHEMRTTTTTTIYCNYPSTITNQCILILLKSMRQLGDTMYTLVSDVFDLISFNSLRFSRISYKRCIVMFTISKVVFTHVTYLFELFFPTFLCAAIN